MTLLIAESTGFSPVALRMLRERMTVVEADLGRADLIAAVVAVDVLWVRLRHRIDEEVLSAAGALRAIVTNTTGLTHIDLEAAARHGVEVISLRGEVDFLRTIRATAELTLGLLLALTRRLPAALTHVRGGGWDRYGFKGSDLYGKTAGIVGLGRLGRIVAGYFNALGMTVVATTADPDPVDGVSLVPLVELLARSDVISVHVDLNPGTHGLFGSPEFAAMKPGAWFINTSRGEVVDEAALIAALESGRLQGAALDVLSGEPLSVTPSHPLVRYASTHDNLLLTPHIGGYTIESLSRTEEHLAGVLLAALGGRRPPERLALDSLAASPRKV